MYTKYNDPTSRGYSPDLWRDCPRDEIMRDRSAGYFFSDDFIDFPTGKYTFTDNTAVGSAATGALSASTDGEAGVLLLSSVSTTSGEGGQIQLPSLAFYAATTKTMWFECRFKQTGTTTAGETFIGLHETDTTILASGALTGANMLGFSSVSDDNVILFTGEKATAADGNSISTTLAEDTYIKLGFRCGIEAGVLVARAYVNGVDAGDAAILAAANIPVLGLTLSAAIHSSGTTAPVMKLDWWDCFVENRS
jgi:hypothetical protein